jgi:hypothetical protein
MPTYDVGDRLRLRVTFTDLDGTPADPTTVECFLLSPSGIETSPTVTNDPTAVGAFYADVDITASGVWTYRFEGTGAVKASEEALLVVDSTSFPAPVPSGLVTVGQYRTITLDTTSSDVAISGALIEAQTMVEEYLGRQLTSRQRTEVLLIDRTGRVRPSAVPITSVSVPVGATIDRFTITDVDPDETPSPFFWTDPVTWGSWQPRATVTYVGGFTSATLPATIRRRIAVEAWSLLHPSDLSAVASGAQSVSVGDASITFGAGGAPGALSVVTERALRPWRLRR